MHLTVTERKQFQDNLARHVANDLQEAVNIDELCMIDLATAAQLLGLSPTHAARILPIVEVGPRTRRVTIADFKAFVEARKTAPKTSAA